MTANSPALMNLPCKICKAATLQHATALVRGKHSARILRCTECGFISMEDPRWLAEAYAEPINRSDTGYVWRNLACRDRVCALIEASQLDADKVFLDYAAGYGLFVRLMRDSGYDFRWVDPYCQNLFSRGFEAAMPLAGQYEAVTAFEVLEHLPNPLKEVQKITSLTPVFIFSTMLVPEPAPQPADWWYYGLEHGQHIAFYTRKSLEALAGQCGCKLTTNGVDFHVLSRKPVAFARPAPKGIKRWLAGLSRRMIQRPLVRPSLTMKDHAVMVKKMQEEI